MTTQAPPTALEQSIRDICAAHNLHSFTVGLLIPCDKYGSGWRVDLQRWEGGKPTGCWQDSGNSIAAALAAALKQIEPVVTLADEALPEIVA